MTIPHVRVAMSSRYWLFRSPKPGAFMDAIFNAPLSLLTTRIARASFFKCTHPLLPPNLVHSLSYHVAASGNLYLPRKRGYEFNLSCLAPVRLVCNLSSSSSSLLSRLLIFASFHYLTHNNTRLHCFMEHLHSGHFTCWKKISFT